MKTKIIYFIFIFYSCGILNGINVEIRNESGKRINNVKFYTTEEIKYLKYRSIEHGKSARHYYSLRNHVLDGSYIIEYTKEDGQIIHHSAGYYTNGGSLDDKVIIRILKDTVLINFY